MHKELTVRQMLSELQDLALEIHEETDYAAYVGTDTFKGTFEIKIYASKTSSIPITNWYLNKPIKDMWMYYKSSRNRLRNLLRH